MREFDRIQFNRGLARLEELLTGELLRTWHRKIIPQYKKADTSSTRLRPDDIEELCMALLRSVGMWKNELVLMPLDELTVPGTDLAPAGRKLDLFEFSRHLRNEVFKDLQAKYGWGAQETA